MIEKVLENVDKIAPDRLEGQQKEKINIIADSGYSSGVNFAEFEKERYKDKIEPYIPDVVSEQNRKGKGGSHKEDPRFDKSRFVYNSEDDTVSCPAGKKLHYIGKSNRRGVMYNNYGNNTAECKKCEYYGICTNSKRGRHIVISGYQPIIDKMREKLSTEEGKKIYGRRKITAEPVLGNLSQNLGFREFLLRDIQKVKGEFLLMCIAHNLIKITKILRNSGKNLKEVINSCGYLRIPGIS